MDAKQMAMSIEHAVARCDLDALGDYYADDLIDHNPFPDQSPGLAGLREKVAALTEGIGDMQTTVDLLVEQGDLVVDRWTSTGTHTGELMGIPATGQSVRVTGISIFRFADGKVIEEWTEFDGIGLMAQVGALDH